MGWPCLTGDRQSSYCMENSVGASARLGGRRNVSKTSQRVPQRPGHQHQYLGVAWPGSSSFAWQSHQRGPVRQKTDGPLKQRKRAAPKARATFKSIAAPTLSCLMCGRAFWARIGLTSHLRTHHQSSVEVMVIFDFRRTNDNKGPGHTTVQEGSDDKYCKAN